MTAFIITLVVIAVLLVRHALRGQSRTFAAGHVGRIGERLELPVTLVDLIAFEKWDRIRHRSVSVMTRTLLCLVDGR